ncbi:MAG: hypothetical protein EOL87_08965 [Spartobacteria bacterium]|nr:hypothetical protein [Spartobacteria bacterium]
MKKVSIILAIGMLWTCTAMASTADDISKKVNNLIKSAENDFFKGNITEASTVLQEAGTELAELKTEDPDHASLKWLPKKYDRLKERIDKKLAGSAPASTPKTATASHAGTPSFTSDVLSSGAKKNLQGAAREMDFAEEQLAKGEKSLKDKHFNLVESHAYNAKSKLDSAQNLLNRVVKSNKADPANPAVASAFNRHKAMSDKLAAFIARADETENAVKQAGAQADADAEKCNKKWLPEIMPFIDASSESRLQYPGSYNEKELVQQEQCYARAEKVLHDVENDVPADRRPHELQQAIKNLRFALSVYEDSKTSDNRNRTQPIERTLSDWEKQLEQNKKWTDTSNQALFVITEKKWAYQKQQIDALKTVDAKKADAFCSQLQALEKENRIWAEKKHLWMERPRPFPQAKMKNRTLENEMQRLLENRDIKVDNLIIVDKDWWVQPGEFRYMAAAVLSKDNKGPYWSTISFRQIKTLTGYAPTEIWDIDETRIRLP